MTGSLRRGALVLTAAAVVLTPLAATAAPAKATKRTVTYQYSGFSNVGSPAVLLNSSVLPGVCTASSKACWDFETVKGEKSIEISASNPSTGLQVFTDGTYAGNVVAFCGKGKISVSPKTKHTISVRTSLDACGGATTSGTLTAVLTAK